MLCDHKQQGFEQAGKIKDAKTRELQRSSQTSRFQ
jgi:hypothetical protein